MPQPSPTVSSLPPASSPEGSSQGPSSPMYEHGEPFEGFSMVELSSEEEDVIPDTSQDEEITQKLFNDLNHGLLGPPGDDHIIVLSDPDEEE
jgi:hypothetical protein